RAARAHADASDRAARNAQRANGFEQQALRAHLQPMMGVAMMEASNRGSATVEAEHVLLGFLFDKTSSATTVLAEHGLDYDSFSDALAAERERTLAAVGVVAPSPERLASTPRARGRGPRFGASSREVWDRTMRRVKARGGGRPTLTHADFIIGILSAELGTVPRALLQAGIDRRPLIDALEATIPLSRKERIS
ncbi:hypothetical protein FJ656_32925, partial [Schumannella luteola]